MGELFVPIETIDALNAAATENAINGLLKAIDDALP